MSDRTKANRGLRFERLITLMCIQYEEEGRAVIYKVPTAFMPLRGKGGQVTGCKVTHKSCVDYLGHFAGIPVALEAKSVQGKLIRYDAVQDHQAQFLDAWQGCGGDVVAAILVSFGDDDVFCVPWAYWRAGRAAWELFREGKGPAARVTVCGCTTTGKASLHPEDLLPEWRVNDMDFLNNLLAFREADE